MGTSYLRKLVAAGALLIAATPFSDAEPQRTQYNAFLYGLRIGQATFESSFEGRSFSITGHFASAGIARIFERTDGTLSVSGRIGDKTSQPREYVLSYTSGQERKSTTIRFRDGRVTETQNLPEEKNSGKDWVPVSDEHLSDVADPLSALMIPAASGDEVCRRTVRIYDGEIRADFVLEPAAERDRFVGAAVTCRARFVPVAGYRKGRSSIAYLREKGRILLGFKPIDGSALFAPVEATIATRIGTVHIKARAL